MKSLSALILEAQGYRMRVHTSLFLNWFLNGKVEDGMTDHESRPIIKVLGSNQGDPDIWTLVYIEDRKNQLIAQVDTYEGVLMLTEPFNPATATMMNWLFLNHKKMGLNYKITTLPIEDRKDVKLPKSTPTKTNALPDDMDDIWDRLMSQGRKVMEQAIQEGRSHYSV